MWRQSDDLKNLATELYKSISYSAPITPAMAVPHRTGNIVAGVDQCTVADASELCNSDTTRLLHFDDFCALRASVSYHVARFPIERISGPTEPLKIRDIVIVKV